MKLLRRHKLILLALGIYWPGIFWLTHIPVPRIAGQSGMSDKTMHVMAYLVLTFLVWFATSPYEKVRWNKPKCWLVVLAVLLYGIIDEYLQARVGRSGDVRDFVANGFGMVLGMVLLSILDFWLSLLTLSAVFIFVLSNVSRVLMLPQYACYDIAFHFTAYTAFSLIWIQYLERNGKFKLGKADWLAVSLVAPAGLLFMVKIAAPFYNHPISVFNIVIGTVGICTAVLVSWLPIKYSRKANSRR
jgi:hypothetical protein